MGFGFFDRIFFGCYPMLIKTFEAWGISYGVETHVVVNMCHDICLNRPRLQNYCLHTQNWKKKQIGTWNLFNSIVQLQNYIKQFDLTSDFGPSGVYFRNTSSVNRWSLPFVVLAFVDLTRKEFVQPKDKPFSIRSPESKIIKPYQALLLRHYTHLATRLEEHQIAPMCLNWNQIKFIQVISLKKSQWSHSCPAHSKELVAVDSWHLRCGPELNNNSPQGWDIGQWISSCASWGKNHPLTIDNYTFAVTLTSVGDSKVT